MSSLPRKQSLEIKIITKQTYTEILKITSSQNIPISMLNILQLKFLS